MKVLTVLGTRPEIIRLSRIIPALDACCDHVLVHTGQNFDPQLSDVFFQELGVRQPDHELHVQAETFGGQVAAILTRCEAVIQQERPARFLVLGDTNSGLSAIVAKRLGIPVYHLEAGNRCYDDQVPEEVNRRMIDHASDVLLPYTERSRTNLLREGILGERIHVVGNPIYEVLQYYDDAIRQSTILHDLGVQPQRYLLATMHRMENVDLEERLAGIATALDLLQQEYGVPVIVSTHPRTRARLQQFGIRMANDAVRFLPPLGFFAFIALERNALCVLSDSGTVQEECCLFRVANVTLRDVTERPETLECGSNILGGTSPSEILRSAHLALARPCQWAPPREYTWPTVSDVVVKIILGVSPCSRAPQHEGFSIAGTQSFDQPRSAS